MRTVFLKKCLHVISLYKVGTFHRIECFFLSFLFFDMLLFETGIVLQATFVQCFKTNIAITEMENNELSEYEGCYRL